MALTGDSVWPEASVHRAPSAAPQARQDETSQSGGCASLESKVVLWRTVLGVFYPPVPRKFIQVTSIADDDESNRHHMHPVSTTGFLRAASAVKGWITCILCPQPGLAQQ